MRAPCLTGHGDAIAVFGDQDAHVDGPYSSGGHFSLLPQGPMSSELQMEELAPGTPTDVEADGADGSRRSAARCSSAELQ